MESRKFRKLTFPCKVRKKNCNSELTSREIQRINCVRNLKIEINR